MNPQRTLAGPEPVVSLEAAEQLRQELSHLGIASDVHDGYGLALVSVWVGLVVWYRHDGFWWRTGWDADRKRAVYARHPLHEPERAARRVAYRYAEVRRSYPPPALIDGAQPCP